MQSNRHLLTFNIGIFEKISNTFDLIVQKFANLNYNDLEYQYKIIVLSLKSLFTEQLLIQHIYYVHFL